MGWLRDLMLASDPPVTSFGRLARAALAHPNWPADTRPQPRSLATLFSKLDREQDLDWLADRLEVQKILAELLDRPLADVQQALPVRAARAGGRLVRLDDLRYGRELDLAREALCPGIPGRVLEPATWGRLCWKAPSGSGRSLVGAWLAARGLATHVTLNGPPSPQDSFPSRGPLFVELTEDAPPPSAETWRAWAELWGAEHRPVCVAMARPPNAVGWETIESPALATILPELVAWVAERLPGDGHFESERALGWMTRVALPSGAVTTLGDALGLLGMLDEVRPRTLHGRSLDEIAESFVRQRLAESSEESTVGTWLHRNAFAALLGTIAQLLTESDHPWNHPRTFDEWLELVPPEYREGIDIDWMRAALRREGTQRVRSADLASAASRLPPGGYQLLRAFEHARILVRDGERLRLRPHWLGTTLQARATHELITLSPAAWGEALLRPPHAGRTLRALLDRVRRGDRTPVYAALELSDAESPAHVAAIEAATTAVGIALGCGVRVPSDLVSDLFAEQESLALVFPDAPPRPRLEHAVQRDDESLLHPAAWLLGAYLLAEVGGRKGALLDPFRHPHPDQLRALLRRRVYPALLELLREISSGPPSVSEPTFELRFGSLTVRAPWAVAVYALVDSLRTALGPVAETPTDLELPAVVAEGLVTGSCRTEHLQRLDRLPFGLTALADRARARGLDLPTFFRSYWRAVEGLNPLPEAIHPQRTGDPLVLEIWREAPVELIRRRARSAQPLPWAALLPHHHAALMKADFPLPPEVSRLAPLDPLLEAIETRGVELLDVDARRALWHRAPRRMLALLHRRLDARQHVELRLLLDSLPDELSKEAFSALGTRIDLTTLPLDDLHPVRSWLADRIGRRVPGWQEAYALLHRVEAALEPLRRHLFTRAATP